MTDHLTRIYTRSGDHGQTRLANGKKLEKSAAQIQAIGEIDELNSCIGLLLTQLPAESQLYTTLTLVQHQLFDIGAELAVDDPSYQPTQQAWVDQLEQQIDQLNAQLPPLKAFILPGGDIAAAHCHLARSTCRRAERALVAANGVQPLSAVLLRYVNRLSDLLFVAARWLNQQADRPDVLWQSADQRQS